VAVFTDEDVVEAARTDVRSRPRRLLAPALALVGAAAALGYVAAVDPNEPGHYPLCPTRALFGVDCPGCGLMRSIHDLVTGNVSGAVDHNVLIVALAPLAIVVWLRWFLRSWRGESPEVTYAQFRRRNVWMVASLVVVLAFGVVRNFVPFLGSGIG
jgi:hypothetical protein